jgi:hypothetical protein
MDLSIRVFVGMCAPCCLAALLVSCSGSGYGTSPRSDTLSTLPLSLRVATVTITGRPLLAVGDTLTFAANPLDAAGAAMSGFTATWSSGATDVATIDPATGLVHAVGVGSARITAAVDGKTADVVLVVRAAGSDVTPPQLVGLAFSPDPIKLGTSGTLVVSAHVVDAGAGTRRFYIEFRSRTGAALLCTLRTPSSGTAQDGTWTCPIAVSQGSTTGVWTAVVVELEDGAGNVRDVEAKDLAAAGFPNTITVEQ